MGTPKSIGVIELSSIGEGFRTADEMLKAAQVSVLIQRTICSGKYFIVVAGAVSDVNAAISAGEKIASDAVIDTLVIPNVHPDVFKAMGQSVVLAPDDIEALGIVESFSATSIIDAADAAAKASKVTIFRIHLAMALGGKGLCLMTGSIADCSAAVRAATKKVSERGLLVSQVVIPNPSKEIFEEYI